MSNISSITSDEVGNIWIATGRSQIRQGKKVKKGIKTVKSFNTGPGFNELDV